MKEYSFTEKKDTRSGFGAGMAALEKQIPEVVALCADLVASLKLDAFIKTVPERFIQCGIAEANMIGVAAGLAISGIYTLCHHLRQLWLRQGV
jgi:transketolase